MSRGPERDELAVLRALATAYGQYDEALDVLVDKRATVAECDVAWEVLDRTCDEMREAYGEWRRICNLVQVIESESEQRRAIIKQASAVRRAFQVEA